MDHFSEDRWVEISRDGHLGKLFYRNADATSAQKKTIRITVSGGKNEPFFAIGRNPEQLPELEEDEIIAEVQTYREKRR